MGKERFQNGDYVKPRNGILEPGVYQYGGKYPGTHVARLRKLPSQEYRFSTHVSYLNPANENEVRQALERKRTEEH